MVGNSVNVKLEMTRLFVDVRNLLTFAMMENDY